MQALLLQPGFAAAALAVLGLAVGSFLNVVIHRLPLMLDRQWRCQCADLLGLPAPAATPFNLWQPRSHCPACAQMIPAWRNIPIASYLLLRGRCATCGGRIAARYPLVEAMGALVGLLAGWHFGYGLAAAAAATLGWALLALAVIDYDTQLLPDDITLPGLWLGLLLALVPVFTPLADAVVGAAAGYLSLWSVYWVHRLLTGREGMGHGDFKLLAMLGAWMGWQQLPAIILLSSAVGAVIGLGLILLRGRDRQLPIPFGPYLAAAGFIALLWGRDLAESYRQWAWG